MYAVPILCHIKKNDTEQFVFISAIPERENEMCMSSKIHKIDLVLSHCCQKEFCH